MVFYGGVECRGKNFDEVFLFNKVLVTDTSRCVDYEGNVCVIRTFHNWKDTRKNGRWGVEELNLKSPFQLFDL